MAIADQSRWRVVATTMSGDATAGGVIVNTTGKTYTHNLLGGKTMQFTMDVANPRANFIMGQDTLIKVYRRSNAGVWNRLMVGDTISAEEVASGNQGAITVTAADPFWRLQRRILGLGVDSVGRGTGYTDGSAATPKNLANVLYDLIANLNAVYYTGIQLVFVSSSAATGFIGPVYAQASSDLIQQICHTLGGPEFELIPLEPSGLMPGTTIAQMNIVSAVGSTRPNALFEYGTGKRNIASYSRVLTKDGICNQAYSPPQGFPDAVAAGDTMVVGQDTVSQSQIGLYQDIVQGDVATMSLRQELANEYVAVRKQARQQITFVPTVDNPMDYGIDYNVGDVVTARAYVDGTYRLNGSCRIYGVTIAEDDNGADNPQLILIPGTS